MGRPPIKLDHIPREDHEGIGLVANSWAHLEGVIERIIWRVARIDDNIGAAITTHIGLKNRLDAACALAELEFPDAEQTARLFKLHGYILGNEMYGKRNEILHSRTLHIAKWSAQSVRQTTKARKRLTKIPKLVVPTEYRETSDTILRTASELREMLSDFIGLSEKKYGTPPP